MGASVRIEDGAFSDRRFDRLARELGLADADHARGKMAVLWRQCTLEQRYTLDPEDIACVLGESGPQALAACRLGEPLASGEIRIKGAVGRIEWLGNVRNGTSQGGQARAASAERDERGRMLPKSSKPGFSSGSSGSSESSCDPASAGGAPPAHSSVPSPSPVPTEREIDASAPASQNEHNGAGVAALSVPDPISGDEAERLGFVRWGGAVGPHAVALAGIFPVTRAQWDEACAGPGKSWPYFAKHVRSIRDRERREATGTTLRQRESLGESLDRAAEEFVRGVQ